MPRNELYAMNSSPDESQIGSIGNPLAYKLHLFGQFGASLRANKIGRKVFPLLNAVSLKQMSMEGYTAFYLFYCKLIPYRI